MILSSLLCVFQRSWLPTLSVCLLSQSVFAHDLSRSREIWPIFIIPRGAIGTPPSLKIKTVALTIADTVDEILFEFCGAYSRESNFWRQRINNVLQAIRDQCLSPKVDLLMRNRNDLAKTKTWENPVVAFGRTRVRERNLWINDRIIVLNSFHTLFSSFSIDFATNSQGNF